MSTMTNQHIDVKEVQEAGKGPDEEVSAHSSSSGWESDGCEASRPETPKHIGPSKVTKGLGNRLVMVGELGTTEESTNLNIYSEEDIVGSGLERGDQPTVLQLLSSIEKRLM